MKFFCIGVLLVAILAGEVFDRAEYRRHVREIGAALDEVGARLRSIEEDVDDLDKLAQSAGNTNYIVMDTLVRVFHYAKPHKAPINGCPECFVYKQRHERQVKERADGLDDPRKSATEEEK